MSTLPTQFPPDENQPFPVRFRWLRRILLAAALFLAFFLVMRSMLIRHIDAQAQQHIAAAHALGQRATVSDYVHPWPPDDQNATVLLMQAGQACSWGYEVEDAYEKIKWTYPMSAAELAKAQPLIQRQAAALALVRQARGRPLIDWKVQYRSPAISILLPHLGIVRNPTRHLNYAASYAHSTGDDPAAIQYLRDALFLSKSLNYDSSNLIQHLVAVGCLSLTCKTIESIAPTLTTPDAASAQEAQKLLADLNDETTQRIAQIDAMLGERTMIYDTLTWMVRTGANSRETLSFASTGGPPDLNWLQRGLYHAITWSFRPLVERDALTTFEYETGLAAAVSKPDGPAAATAIPAMSQNLCTPLPAIFLPSFNRCVVTFYRGLRDRRSAAIALATRLYELAHDKPPASIGDLVPEFLPAVPLDPVAGNGALMSLPISPATRPATAPALTRP